MNVYEADDDEEWRLVISEVTAFMEVGMKSKGEYSQYSVSRSRRRAVSLLLDNYNYTKSDRTRRLTNLE